MAASSSQNPVTAIVEPQNTKPVVNAYGQTVLHPNLGSPLAPLATTPAKSTITQASAGQTAPTTTVPPTTTTTTPSTSPPASLGTLSYSEQGIWNTLVGDLGVAAATQAIINSRALNAGASGIKSGQIQTITVTPQGGVTTVLPSGTTTKGQASATNTGIVNTVPVPTITPPKPTDSYYIFTNPNTNQVTNVTATQYNSWTPEQQFAFQQSIGNIPNNATIYYNKDGSWGYSTPSQVQAVYNPSTAPIMTQQLLTYLQNNNPQVYSAIQSQGSAYAWGQYADIISAAILTMIASLPSSQQLTIAQEYGVVPKNATSIIVNKDGTLSYTTGSVATTFDTWANGLTSGLVVGSPAYIANQTLKNIYDEAGGGLKGYLAVVQDQVSGLNTYLKDIYTNAYNSALKSNPDTVAASNAGLDAVNSAQSTAIATLQNYMTDGLPDPTKLASGKVDDTVLLAAGYTPQQIQQGIYGVMPTVSILKSTPQTTISPITGKTIVTQVTKVPTGMAIIPQTTNAQATIALTQTIYANGLVNAEPTQQSIKVLQEKGYNQAIIDAAQKQVDATGSALMAIDAGLQLNNLTKAQVAALHDAIHGTGLSSNFSNWVYDVAGLVDADSYNAVKSAWDKLTPMEQAQVANLYSQDLYSTNYFAEYAKNWAEIAKDEGILGQASIGMITNITTPIAQKVTGQYVSADEIKNAIITGAIDVSMAMGVGELIDGLSEIAPVLKTLSGELMVGAGALNAPSVISALENPDVSLGQKALATGGEALLLGGGALGIKGGITEAISGTPAEIAAAKVASAETVAGETINPITERVPSTTSGIQNVVAKTGLTYNQIVANVASGTVSAVTNITDTISNIRTSLGDTVYYIKNYAYDDANLAIQSARETISNVSAQIVANAGKLSADTVANLQIALSDAKSNLDSVVSYLKNNAYDDATIALQNMKTSLGNTANQVVSNVGKLSTDALTNIQVGLGDVKNALGDAVTTISNGAYDNTVIAINEANRAISDLSSQLVANTGKFSVDTVNNISVGLNDAKLALVDATNYIKNNAYQDATIALKTAGEQIAVLSSQLASNVGKVSLDVTTNIYTGLSDVKGTLDDVANYLKNNAYDDAAVALTSAINNVNNLTNQLLSNAGKLSTDTVTNLYISLSDAKVALTDALKDIGDKAYDTATITLRSAADNVSNATSQFVSNVGKVSSDVIANIDTGFNDAKSSLSDTLNYLKNNAYDDANIAVLRATNAVEDLSRQVVANAGKLSVDVVKDMELGLDNIKTSISDASNYIKNNAYDDAVIKIKGAVEDLQTRIEYYKLSAQTTAHEFALGLQSAKLAQELNDALDKVKTMDDLQTLKDSAWYKDTMQEYQDSLDARIKYYESQLKLMAPLSDKLSTLELGTENVVKNALVSDYVERFEYLKTMQRALNYQRLIDMFSDKPYVNAEGGITEIQRQSLLKFVGELDDKEQAKMVQDLLNEHPSDFAKSMQKLMDAKATGNLDDLTDNQLATFKVWMAQETQQDYINALKSVLDPRSSDFAKLMDKLTSSAGKIDLDDFTPEQRAVLENWQKISAMQDYINALKSAVDPHSGDFVKLMDRLTQGNRTIDLDNLSEADISALKDFTDNLADQKIKELFDPHSSDFAKTMQKLINAKVTGNMDGLTDEQLTAYKIWQAQESTQSYIDALNSALDPHSSNFANLWDKLMTAKSTGDLDALTETERGVYNAWQSKVLTQDYIDALNKALDPHYGDFAKTMDSLMNRTSVNKQIIDDIDAEIKNSETLKNDLSSNPDKIEGLIKRANDTMDNAPSSEIQAKLAELRDALSRAADREHEVAGVEDAVNQIKNDFIEARSEKISVEQEAEAIVKEPQDYLKAIQEKLDRISKLEADAKAQGIEDLRPITDAEKELLNKDIESYLKSVQRSNIAETKQIMDELNNYLKNPQRYNLDIEKLIERLNKGETGITMSPEALELWQSISADTQRISQLSNIPDATSEIAQLSERIQENMGKLLDLSKIEKPLTAEQLSEVINSKLKDLGYSDDNIAKLTDSQKINIVVNGKPYEVFDYKVSEQINELSDKISQDQEILKGLENNKSAGLSVDDSLIKTLQEQIAENQDKLDGLKKLTPEPEITSEEEIPSDEQPLGTGGGKSPTETSPEPSGEKVPEQEPQKETSVATEVKPETKVEEETVTKTPEELEEMMKEKEQEETPEEKTPVTKTETETSPEVKPEQKAEQSRSPSTKTEIQVSQPESEPYWTWVWENGAVVFKQVTPQKLQQLTMTQELDAERALEIQRENDAAQQLAQRLGISLQRALEMIQNGSMQLAIPSQVQQMEKVQQQVMEKEPAKQPEKLPQIAPQTEVQTPQPIKEVQPVKVQEPIMVKEPQPEKIPQPQPEKIPPPETETITKTIPPVIPIVLTKSQQADIQKIKDRLVPRTITWRQGKVRYILPPRKDGTYHNEDKFAVSSKTPVAGVTKFYTGEGSAYATLEFIGGKSKVPFKETTVDLGFSVVRLHEENGELKMEVNPDESANWEGVNKYTKEKEEEQQYLDYQQWRAQYTGKPPEGMPIPVAVKPFKESPPEMHRVEWTQYSRKAEIDGHPIIIEKVDGQWVRENLDPEWTQGGHWLVYNYVPKYHVWIERMRNPEEDKFSLGHELDEVHDMYEHEEPYHPAHESAKEREFGTVRKSQNVDKELEASLSKFVPERDEQERPENIPEPRNQNVMKKSRKRVIIDDNKRYYLGHETRQPELVANV
jgi:hypothetical protein